MKFKLKKQPAYFPVTLDQGKKQAEIDDTDDSHDEYVRSLIRMATDNAEQILHRRLITQTWEYWLDGWPWSGCIELPFGRLQSVTSIKYKDQDGNETTWPTTEYIVDNDTDPGKVCLAYEKVFPTDTLYPVNPIKVEFICGYFMGEMWVKETAYAAGYQAIPIIENGLVYSGTVGTSAATEPDWPLTIGGTVVDNDITWTCIGESVPDNIRHAIKLYISDAFENREMNYFVINPALLGTYHNLLDKYVLHGSII